MEWFLLQEERVHDGIGNFLAGLIFSFVENRRDAQSFLCLRVGNEIDDRGAVNEWLPRQFWLMKENIRCSMVFHLLVPGGKWRTEIGMRMSSARRCNRTFQRRVRYPLLPPQSAVMRSLSA